MTTPDVIILSSAVAGLLATIAISFVIRRFPNRQEDDAKKKEQWSIRVGYKPVSEKTPKSVLSLLAMVIGKMGKKLLELSERLDRQESGNTGQ